MGDEDEWKNLPTVDKVVHKVWKCRVAGYEEAVKKFRFSQNDKDPVFNDYLGLVKKFVIDSNAVAQEKGLEAVLSFTENAACATKCCDEVIAGIVLKVLNARPKSKQLGIDICLMYIELEKQDVVLEELGKGFDNKQPKIVAAAVQTVTTALSEFGGKTVKMKNLVQAIPKLLGHNDKTVREQTKMLAIEIFKWIRDAIKPQLQNIKPVQMKELEDEWAKVDPAPPKPQRFTKTEQAKMAANATTDSGGSTAVAADNSAPGATAAAPVSEAPVSVSVSEAPVEILSKLPKDFYEQTESKKWQERKEALEALDKLTSNQRLENGQYAEVCTVLKKIITKDSNINVVALAGKCVTGLAKGLRKKFQTYTTLLIPAIFGKFKEKKLNVVISLRDALDACFATTNFTNIMEDLLQSLDNKNPSIKEETCKFLTRSICVMQPAALSKPLLKQIIPPVISKLDDTVGPVREAAAECLGTALKLVSDRVLGPYLEPLDKIRQEKIKEYADKAEIGGSSAAPAGSAVQAAPPAAAAPSAAAAAPPKKEVKDEAAAKKGPPAKKAPAKKPAGSGPKKTDGGKKGGADKKKKKKGNDFETDEAELSEAELPEGVVEEQAETLFSAERLHMLASNNWKERLEAVNEMSEVDCSNVQGQVIVRTLAKKPGWKDSNFQVLNGKFKMLADVAGKGNITRRSATYAVSGLISKIGDIKLKTQVKETLKLFSENISLNYISLQVAKAAEEAKNPKLQTEALVWMTESVREFGFRINLKPHVQFIKSQLGHVNPGVRKAAIEFLATLFMYVGPNIRIFFEEEKPALLQQIDAEFEKVKDEKPPVPTRRFKDDEDEEEPEGNAADENDGGEDEGGGGGAVDMEEKVERVDISSKITDGIMEKAIDKNWKIRKEGLEEIQTIITTAKFIVPELGEFPTALKSRLGDNNKVIQTMAIAIVKQLAESGGKGMVKYKNTILPAIIGTLSDAKPHLRKQGEDALDMWHSKIGFLPFLDNEILSTALKEKSPYLKASLLGWLATKLPNEKKLPAELKESILPLYECLEDRNPDVRNGAQTCVPLIMAHVGYDTMFKATSKVAASSQGSVQGLLEKARETVVPIAAPGAKSKATSSKSSNSSAASAAASAAAASAAAASAEQVAKEPDAKQAPKKEKSGKTGGKKSAAPPTSKAKAKQDVDEGPSLIHKVGKADRAKDEKKLKVLKWNFTTPRDEIIDQLKEQMRPIVSPGMHIKLFHADFKVHLEAINIFRKAINENADAILESLDLILKWTTLRFFETNTSVLIKTLDFISDLCNMLESREYQFTPLEAVSFIPYLVQKIGDPKDNVRKSVKDILKVITAISPASKTFTYLMEALPSKNSKIRMECCEEVGFLIGKFGMEVCQPSPKVLKEVAAQISDRDNGVRSAALNCIVAAYNIVGDDVYKLIGRLNDKDMGYLEERIKRTGKSKPPPESSKPKIVKPDAESKPVVKVPPEIPSEVDDSVSNTGTYRVHRRGQPPPQRSLIKREFELDLDAIEGGEGRIIGTVPQLEVIDMNAVNEAASIPEHLLQRYVHTHNQKKNGSTQVIEKGSVKDTGAILDLTIAKISSADMHTAMESLVQMEEVFKRQKTNDELLKRIDQYLVTALVQFKMLFSRHIENTDNSREDVERLLKLLLSGMLVLFDTKCYSTVVTRNVLKDVIYFFISVLSDKVFDKLDEGSREASIQCVNKLLLRVLTNSDKTNCLGGTIKLLQELSENVNTAPNIMKLLMKCIWKLTHLLPDFINEINLNVLLVDIHTFYKVLPPSFWKTKTDRVPQQTMKALLNTLRKLRGSELVECLSSIEDPEASEVATYIRKHCPTDSSAPVCSTPKARAPPPQLKSGETSSTNEEPSDDILIEIFKKIGSKENARAGINDLYHFKKKYPNYNVDPYIKSATPFFQNFIDRSLKMIAEDEKMKQQQEIDLIPSQPSLRTDSNISSDSAQFLERLKALKDNYIKASRIQPDNTTASEPPPPVTEPEPIIVEKIPSIKYDTDKDKEKTTFDIGDIKNRLEQIKMGLKPPN